MRAFLIVYRLGWRLAIPFVQGYIRRRAAKDPAYAEKRHERFGIYEDIPRSDHETVWIHAVSLGELRSAVPLIEALAGQGERIVVTTFTPAGRREAKRALPDLIDAGTVTVVWVPLELDVAYRRFRAHFRPRYGLVMEVEFWPVMIDHCRRAGLPLFLCNGQYPEKSLRRDRGRLRAELVRGFAGVMVKSPAQAEIFSDLGQENIRVTGELRFEQPIPPAQIAAAEKAHPAISGGAGIVTIASGVEKEEDLLAETIRKVRDAPDPPRFVYVPRAPERFDAVAGKLAQAGLTVARRSEVFDADLTLTSDFDADVLLGDSFGEMYFYLALAERVVVGGGFAPPRGAHNVIEPMALGKPVLVGPSIWTIEYIARDAIDAGVVRVVQTGDELAQALAAPLDAADAQATARFFQANAGAVAKTLAAIDDLLETADTSRRSERGGGPPSGHRKKAP